MTLTNQKTSIQLLVPTFSKDFSEHKGMIVSNDGAMCFFAPFGFPIHGRYYDYGQIEDIERDANVEMLEDFFNLSIEQILENVGDDRWHKYGEKRDGDSTDNHWKITGKDGGAVKNQDVFLELGMTYFRTEVLEYLEEGWKDLIPGAKEHGQYTIGGRIGQYFDELKKLRKEDKSIFGSKYESKYGTSLYLPSLIEISMWDLLPITQETSGDEMLKQVTFLYNLGYRKLGKMLLPSVYGSQQDNWFETLKFNKFTNDLLVKDINEYNSWMIEDYTTDGVFDKEGFIEDYGEKYLEQIEMIQNG